MRVGIDFGTTHTVVAVVDRGNYPVVFLDGMDTWPSLIVAGVAPYDPVLFPLDPALHDREDLGRQQVGRWNDGPEVEERYVVAPSGAVEVTLTTQPAVFQRTFRLERRVCAGV